MQQCRDGWDATSPCFKARSAASEGELDPEDLKSMPQHCGQLSATINPASFPFLSLHSGILRNTHKKEKKKELLLRSLSAPTASSSLEGIDKTISCCVTGGMLTVTDEQEEERCATSFMCEGTPVRIGPVSSLQG